MKVKYDVFCAKNDVRTEKAYVNIFTKNAKKYNVEVVKYVYMENATDDFCFTIAGEIENIKSFVLNFIYDGDDYGCNCYEDWKFEKI